jgi:TolB-like protein
MGLIKQVRERRLIAYVGAYLVTGFVALEGVDQLISHEIIPAVAYPIALVFYVFGMLGSLTFAWYHGEKGRQETTRGEVVIHTSLFVLAIAASASVFTSQRRAAELAAAAASSGLEANSLAVLYFEDLSAGGELDFVAAGITEALIDELSLVRSLSVISKNGVLPYRAAPVTVDSIARALEVGSVIRGSVEQTGDRLRVTIRLVDGFSGADIERTSLEIPAGEFLAARDSVAESASRLLRSRLGDEVQIRQLRAGTENVEAWSLVQRAETLIRQGVDAHDAGDFDGSIGLLSQADTVLARAESADPSWVRPPALRAHAAWRRAFFTAISTGELDKADSEISAGLGYVDRALDRDSGNGYALEQQGTLLYVRYLLGVVRDPDDAAALLNEAQRTLEAAVGADPTLATAYSALSHLYYSREDRVSVVLNARRAYEEDAYLRDADEILMRLFYAHYDIEQLRDAADWCSEGAQRFPTSENFAECRLWLLAAPGSEAKVDSAWAYQEKLESLSPEHLRPYKQRLGAVLVGGVLLQAGQRDSAVAVFERARADDTIDPVQDLLQYEAAMRATNGDPDGAVEVLRRWVAANPQATFGTRGTLHWWWRELRDRPDFQALLDRTA